MPIRSKALDTDWAAAAEAIVRGASSATLERVSLAAQVRLLALLGSAAPLNTLLEGLARFVETWAEGLYCSVLLVDRSGTQLVPGAAPSLPPAYALAIGPVTIAGGQGCCGTAAARGQLVAVEDVEQSELWTGHWHIAVAYGLRACWSVPIFDDSKTLLGTLALYYHDRRSPSPRELDLIQFASSLAAFVIGRHRDAERRRTSEARLDAAVWGTDMGLWESRADGEFQWFEDWCARFDLDPCVGDGSLVRWRARVHPDDVERYMASDSPCWQGTIDHYSVEYRLKTLTGDWRWLHERGKVTARAPDGTPEQFVGMCFDIDRRKQLEAALRNAEARYEVAVTAARLPVWEYEIASDTVRTNVHWQQVLGYPVVDDEVAGRIETWLNDIHSDDKARRERIFQSDACDGDGFYESEFRMRTATGDYKWLLDRGRVVERAPDGAPRRVVGVSVDIDALKRLEQTLRDSEHRMETTLWSSKAAFWTINVQSDRAQMSPQFFELTGIDREAWNRDQHPWNSRMHPDDRPAARRAYEDYNSGKLDFYESEYRLNTPAGWRWMHDRGRIVEREPDGAPRLLAGTTQDATARKSLERALTEATQAEQRRLSYELHDGLGQELSGIQFMLSSLVTRLRREDPLEADRLDEVVGLVRQSIATTRSIAHGLAPASLGRGGLRVALHELARDVSKAYRIRVACVGAEWDTGAISDTAALNLFRMSQEALTNARRHGAARRRSSKSAASSATTRSSSRSPTTAWGSGPCPRTRPGWDCGSWLIAPSRSEPRSRSARARTAGRPSWSAARFVAASRWRSGASAPRDNGVRWPATRPGSARPRSRHA